MGQPPDNDHCSGLQSLRPNSEVLLQWPQYFSFSSLVRSQLTYSSQIWRPHLIKEIVALERVQRRASKFILNDFQSTYQHCLISLTILPLMMQFELHDILFFIRCLKEPDTSQDFPFQSVINFSKGNTRSTTYR